MNKISNILLPFLIMVLILIVAAQSFFLLKLYRQNNLSHEDTINQTTCSLTKNIKTPVVAASTQNTKPDHNHLFIVDTQDQWNPFMEMQKMQQQMDSMFQHGLNRFNTSPTFKNFSNLNMNFLPEIDIQETDKNYVAKLDLPGMEKDSIDIKLQDRLLTIAGTRNEKKEENSDDKFFRQEISYGKFSRTITLPGPVKNELLEAKYENGVLTIIIPKQEQTKTAQKIPIS